MENLRIILVQSLRSFRLIGAEKANRQRLFRGEYGISSSKAAGQMQMVFQRLDRFCN